MRGVRATVISVVKGALGAATPKLGKWLTYSFLSLGFKWMSWLIEFSNLMANHQIRIAFLSPWRIFT